MSFEMFSIPPVVGIILIYISLVSTCNKVCCIFKRLAGTNSPGQPLFLWFNLTKGFNIMGRTIDEKIIDLTKEMCNNNRSIAKETAKMKGIKDTIKAFAERNAVIVDELNVHTEDDFNTDAN